MRAFDNCDSLIEVKNSECDRIQVLMGMPDPNRSGLQPITERETVHPSVDGHCFGILIENDIEGGWFYHRCTYYINNIEQGNHELWILNNRLPNFRKKLIDYQKQVVLLDKRNTANFMSPALNICSDYFNIKTS